MASLGGIDARPEVQDGNLLKPGCALTVKSAVAESRHGRDYWCVRCSPNKPDYDRQRQVDHSMLG